jgi:hypothetical protein
MGLSGKGLLLSLLLVSPALYAGACMFWSKKNSKAFDAIHVGDTRDTVVRRFGPPSHVEQPDALFSRYADKRCQDPCVERLWFENRLTLDTEAWSIELDKDGRVIRRSHWVSP